MNLLWDKMYIEQHDQVKGKKYLNGGDHSLTVFNMYFFPRSFSI